MADPATYRPASGSIPESPGVYRFRDENQRVIYVGKAKNLRARLSSYFQDVSGLHSRTRSMVFAAVAVDWTVVSTEVEALQLEYTWIKEHDPRFNVRYRDDKSYPYLAISTGEEFPRVFVTRGPKRPGVRYFGPYSHAWAIRESLDLLLRVFPMRSCSSGVFKRAGQIGRPCLLGYIDKCSAPCVEKVSLEEHRNIVNDMASFLSGDTARFVRRLEREMKTAAAATEYERAGRLRDQIGALTRAMEANAVVLPDATDADVIAVAMDALEAAVAVFHVRAGRIRGERAWVVDLVEDLSAGDVIEKFIQRLYGDETSPEAVPREVLVPSTPSNANELEIWLADRRGSNVSLRVPQRGDKRDLLATVTRNAEQALALHKVKRTSDLTTRSQALAEIQEALGLDEAPLRIECYDISNLQSTDMVASMVVFEDGLSRKSEYRRFAIRQSQGRAPDDATAIHQVLTRRFVRLREERDAISSMEEEVVAGGRTRRFAYPPQLVVVDGGAPQVAAAAAALAEQGITDVALCGLAKRLEELWLPGESDPLILPRSSEGLYLLQRIRDEAHRFAITYHRSKRSKTMFDSLLDEIPGLGEGRRRALMAHFRSIQALRAATVDEIAAVPGIGPRTAEVIHAALAATPQEPAVNMSTGEILDS
jgi:excinuclease ABC subunit C